MRPSATLKSRALAGNSKHKARKEGKSKKVEYRRQETERTGQKFKGKRGGKEKGKRKAENPRLTLNLARSATLRTGLGLRVFVQYVRVPGGKNGKV